MRMQHDAPPPASMDVDTVTRAPKPRGPTVADKRRDVLLQVQSYLEGLRAQKYFAQRHYKLDLLIDAVKQAI